MKKGLRNILYYFAVPNPWWDAGWDTTAEEEGPDYLPNWFSSADFGRNESRAVVLEGLQKGIAGLGGKISNYCQTGEYSTSLREMADQATIGLDHGEDMNRH